MTTRARAAIVATGTEILLGRIQDTNSSFLARALEAHGVQLERITAVDDRESSLIGGLNAALGLGVDLVVTTGGLGPTHDDRTVDAIAKVTGRPLAVDAPTLARIEEIVGVFAAARGVDPAQFAAGNRKQAQVPAGAEVLAPVGTAPGLVVPHGEQRLVVLPGPPVELAQMWPEAERSPLLAPLLARGALRRRVLRIYGVSESAIADAFAELGGDEPGTETTICASRSEIEVVVRSEPAAAGAAERLAAGIRERFGDAVYAEGEARLEEIVLERLRARGLTLATAESCTAGLVASRLASVPGASDVLCGGIVAYADDVKRRLLDVPAEILREHGAVSAECARAMAEGAARRLGVDVAVAVTGVAGPGGGTPAKPVGLVYVHACGHATDRAVKLHFPGPRENVREWSATAALHLVRRLVESDPETGEAPAR